MNPKTDPRRPTVLLELHGPGGNAYAVMGAVQTALKRAGYSKDEVDTYLKEATSGDYENLLKVTRKWVDVSKSLSLTYGEWLLVQKGLVLLCVSEESKLERGKDNKFQAIDALEMEVFDFIRREFEEVNSDKR